VSVVARRPYRSSDDSAAVVLQALPDKIDVGVVCITLFLSANAILPLILNPDIGTDPTITVVDPISRPVWLLLIVFALAGVIRQGRAMLVAMLRNGPILALCWLAILSVGWSHNVSVTKLNSIMLLITTILGFYIGVKFEIRRIVVMLAWVGLVISILSAFFALAMPKYGIDVPHESVWRGVFTTKNELGRMTVEAGMAWLTLLITREAPRGRCLVALAIIAFVNVESNARTSIAVTGLLFAVWGLVWLFRRRGRMWVPAKGLAISGLAFVIAASLASEAFLLGLVGADASFTGRTGIWNSVLDHIAMHPWLGWGMDGFWGNLSSPAVDVWRSVGFLPPHSHDGFLDLLLNLGIVGMGLFLWSVALVFRGGLRHLRELEGSARFFPLVYLSLFLLYNISESSLLAKQSLPWLLYVAMAAAVSIPTPSQRQAAAR
jgi:exopolysaccharide production protein ExoQ